MEFEAPKVFSELLPADLRAYAVYILAGSVCVGGLFVILVLVTIVKLLFGRKAKPAEPKNLVENLDEYPNLKSTSGDRQLRVEGVPVRLRLVVVAPAGTASEFEVDELAELLEKVLPGLGEIYKNDKPRVKVWPTQVSYKGFATHFHKNMKTGAEEGELTRWVLVAGRAKLGKQQIMLGLGMQTIKPNTVGRRTVDSHEWANVLRVRVKD
jgi:hypothetical protein